MVFSTQETPSQNNPVHPIKPDEQQEYVFEEEAGFKSKEQNPNQPTLPNEPSLNSFKTIKGNFNTITQAKPMFDTSPALISNKPSQLNKMGYKPYLDTIDQLSLQVKYLKNQNKVMKSSLKSSPERENSMPKVESSIQPSEIKTLASNISVQNIDTRPSERYTKKSKKNPSLKNTNSKEDLQKKDKNEQIIKTIEQTMQR